MDKYKRKEVPDWLPIGAQLNEQLEDAQQEIKKYDYIGIKIATGISTIEDYVEEIDYMESIRVVIREIEQEIRELETNDE